MRAGPVRSRADAARGGRNKKGIRYDRGASAGVVFQLAVTVAGASDSDALAKIYFGNHAEASEKVTLGRAHRMAFRSPCPITTVRLTA